jgi:trk system potassium uptake protein
LAKRLEHKHNVKLIEYTKERAEHLSGELDKTIVFHGDASDADLLIDENVENIDAFIAVTNDDEANIMSAMLAKRLGAKKAMVLIQRSAYVDLVQSGEIDIAFSPQQATISALLTHVRRGDIVNVYSLRRGAAEAIEAIAHGDKNTSKVIGRELNEIKLPPGTTIGAIVRADQVIIAHSDTVIQANDHVILFLVDKKFITDVEKLFQPSAIFF